MNIHFVCLHSWYIGNWDEYLVLVSDLADQPRPFCALVYTKLPGAPWTWPSPLFFMELCRCSSLMEDTARWGCPTVGPPSSHINSLSRFWIGECANSFIVQWIVERWRGRAAPRGWRSTCRTLSLTLRTENAPIGAHSVEDTDRCL